MTPVANSTAQSKINVITHNLQLHSLALQLNGSNLEVDTDSANVALGVRVVRETQQETGLGKAPRTRVNIAIINSGTTSRMTNLADTRIPNKEELEEIVVFAGMHGGRVG